MFWFGTRFGLHADPARYCACHVEGRANCDRLLHGLSKIHAMIRAEWKHVRSEIESLRSEKHKLEDNFWAVCPNY